MTLANNLEWCDELHLTAVRNSGLDDFGEPAYRDGLRAVLDAYDSDMRLTSDGRQYAHASILQILNGRLHAQRGWAEHPELLSSRICHPVVITGLPRTGTTALHRLLGTDPQFQGLEAWLQQTPLPRPPRHTWNDYAAYRACVARFELFHDRVPQIRMVHDFSADDLEECTSVLMQSFMHPVWDIMPTYARWLSSQDTRASYRRYADVLRLIGGRTPHKRWVLKSPYHMFDIDSLLEVFPDACIIQTHRDPVKAIPSLCSMTYMYRRNLEGEASRREIIGPMLCAHWHRALERMEAARRKHPARFFDVDHRQFLLDPLGVVDAIYHHFDLAPSSAGKKQMDAWVVATPLRSHGTHSYVADSWGVTPEQIRGIFAEYRSRHRFN